jgi:hypothetical protein
MLAPVGAVPVAGVLGLARVVRFSFQACQLRHSTCVQLSRS